jgi:hypothetical protein
MEFPVKLPIIPLVLSINEKEQPKIILHKKNYLCMFVIPFNGYQAATKIKSPIALFNLEERVWKIMK